MKNKVLQNKYINRILWISIFAVLWQGVAVNEIFDPMIFPTINRIIKSLYAAIMEGQMIQETVFSLAMIGKGLVIGFFSAMILSSLCIVSRTFHGLLESIIAVVHPLPGIALLPLIILWIGTGKKAVIFIIVHSIMWPMLLNILAGFKAVPKEYKEVGRIFGLNQIGIIRLIMIPRSLPYILAGLKIGWSRAWRALISAEMIFGAVGGEGGLGWYIFQKRIYMDTVGIYGGLIMIIVIGVFVEDFIFSMIENRTIKKWGMSI
ncbi:ABC transporter permease subunit [Clostridiaceae bacterium 35-E11]